jgi:hypothetical protein
VKFIDVWLNLIFRLFHEVCTGWHGILFLHCGCGFVSNLVCWCCNGLACYSNYICSMAIFSCFFSSREGFSWSRHLHTKRSTKTKNKAATLMIC